MDSGCRCNDCELIGDGFSYAQTASKLDNGLKDDDIYNRWRGHMKESSGIIKPPVQPGFPSRITWTVDDDAVIVRMRTDDISFTKIASKLGNGVTRNDVLPGPYR